MSIQSVKGCIGHRIGGKRAGIGRSNKLGVSGFATRNSITTAVSRGATTIVAITIHRGQTGALIAKASGSRTTIPRGQNTAII